MLPELAGRLDGVALRVPVENGSISDLTCELSEPATAAEVNAAFVAAADGPMAGVLRYTDRPLVSRDVVGDPASCVVDGGLTQADGTMAKVFGWYDNEWGYTNRLVDLTELMRRPRRRVAMTQVKRWSVDIYIDEHEENRRTWAEARLHTGDRTDVRGVGTSSRHPRDREVPEIGDELAVSRALADLADHLHTAARLDVVQNSDQPTGE